MRGLGDSRNYFYKNKHLEHLSVEGKRYPLQKGRVFKASGKRGFYVVHGIFEHNTTGHVEVHAWWSDRLQGPTKSQWRVVALDDVVQILKKTVDI